MINGRFRVSKRNYLFSLSTDFHLRLAFERIFAVGIVGMSLVGLIIRTIFQVDCFGKGCFNSH